MNLRAKRHLLLLTSILSLFILTPALVALHHGVLFLNVIAAIVFLAGSYTVIEQKRLFLVAIVLSIVSIATTWMLLIFRQHWAVITSHGCLALLLAFFAIVILRYVLEGGRVIADKIFAAVCVYMLIGYTFAFAFALLEEIQPGAFTITVPVGPNDYVERVMQMRYFSFITLTTLGFGDIVPKSSAARTMAALEGVVGQIYLTVLVARLVGLHIVHTSRR